LHLAYTLQS